MSTRRAQPDLINALIGALVAAAITALVGAGTYLWLHSRSDTLALEAEISAWGKEYEPYAEVGEMTRITNDGVLASSHFYTRVDEIVRYIARNAGRAAPDAAFLDAYRHWYGDVWPRLFDEKGRIEGFAFGDPALVHAQALSVAEYARDIELVGDLDAAVLNWDHESEAKRRARLARIATDGARVGAAIEAIKSFGRQRLDEFPSAQRTLAQRRDTLEDERVVLARKTFGSLAVMLAGTLALIAWAGWLFVRGRDPAPRAPAAASHSEPRPKVPRKRTGRRKRRR